MTNQAGNDGVVFVGCDMQPDGGGHAHSQPKRREVVVNGKRVKTVDIHAHCVVPEAIALMGQSLGGGGMRTDLDLHNAVDIRLGVMDAQGIDVEALSINPLKMLNIK